MTILTCPLWMPRKNQLTLWMLSILRMALENGVMTARPSPILTYSARSKAYRIPRDWIGLGLQNNKGWKSISSYKQNFLVRTALEMKGGPAIIMSRKERKGKRTKLTTWPRITRIYYSERKNTRERARSSSNWTANYRQQTSTWRSKCVGQIA